MATELYNSYHEKITLTKEQESCLNYTGNRTLMVKGLAGAGKSLVLQGLAKKLLAGYSADKHNKVAIFTFSNTLNSATKEFLQINGEQGDFITVTTLSSYITHVYQAMKGPRLKVFTDPLYTKLRKEAVQAALDEHKNGYGVHRFHNIDLQFWLDEFDWMKDMNVSVQDREYYLSLPRKGRGEKVRMTAQERETAFQIFLYYDKAMKEKGLGDWIDHALYIIRHADQISDKFKFDHILIDEAQDLSLTYMKAAMMFFRKDMVVAMDMNQRIFDKQWTPKQLGIETTTKKLTKSMRTTKQIDNLAESVRKRNEEILGEEDKMLRAIPEVEGPIPKLIHVEDPAAEKKYVIELVRSYLKQKSNISIGIIAARNIQIKTYAAWMTDANIPHEIIQKDSTFSMAKSGVKLVNVYNAKGLEFTSVIIPQFIEGNFPYRYQSEDEEEMKLFMAKCRNLVYVGMTRAKYSLDIIYSGSNGSRFIGEMDKRLYEAQGLPPSYSSATGISTVKTTTQKVRVPRSAPVPTAENSSDDLKAFFKSKGLEVIDKRSAGGCLWVVGEKDAISSVVQEAGKTYGAYGNYSAGGRATKNRPGWFTKCKK